MADRPCLDCPTLVPRGRSRCALHAKPAWSGRRATGSMLDNGSTRAWRQLRAKVLARDPVCMLRLVCSGAPSAEPDHIVPRSAGGPDTMENLRGVCGACHARRRS